MLKVWLYGFAVKVRSTRKLEQRIQEDLGFRYLAGGLRPDHKTLSEFLRRHGEGIEELFTQVLSWDRQAAEGLREQMSKPLAMASSEKRSVTDPDARFLRERGGRFRLGYSGELAVSEDHFIVAARVTQQAADTASRLPMVDEVERHCRERPRQVLA